MAHPIPANAIPRRAVLATPLVVGLAAAAGPAHAAATAQGDDPGMDTTVTHLNPDGLHVNAAYSQAVIVAAPAQTIYIGGQNAVDVEGQIVGPGDLAAQTEQVFTNLEIVLAAAGATLADIVKWTIFVVQGQDFATGLEVFQRHWDPEWAPPAISVVQVAGLANPEFLVEIEAVAVTQRRSS